MKISASVYSSPDTSLRELVTDLDRHAIDCLHIDCRDQPQVFDDIREIRTYSQTPIDLHLITEDPTKYFEAIRSLNVEFVTFQYEDLKGFTYDRSLPARVGLAIVSDTDVQVFDPEQYDFVLMMATVPGQSGGAFDKVNFRKVREFSRRFPGVPIHVDGGVNGEVSFILRNLGVSTAVVGSYLFRSLPLGAALLNLKTHEIGSHYLVRDFMRSRYESPILGPHQRSLSEVLQSIEDHKLGFTILEDAEQRLEGIISNADVRRELMRVIGDHSSMEVSRMMNRKPVTVNDQLTVQAMLAQVKTFTFPINYMPVIDEAGKTCGVVSFLNLVKGEM